MIYRRDLIEHFEWLRDSKYLNEVLDEALVATDCARKDSCSWVLRCRTWRSVYGICATGRPR